MNVPRVRKVSWKTVSFCLGDLNTRISTEREQQLALVNKYYTTSTGLNTNDTGTGQQLALVKTYCTTSSCLNRNGTERLFLVLMPGTFSTAYASLENFLLCSIMSLAKGSWPDNAICSAWVEM